MDSSLLLLKHCCRNFDVVLKNGGLFQFKSKSSLPIRTTTRLLAAGDIRVQAHIKCFLQAPQHPVKTSMIISCPSGKHET